MAAAGAGDEERDQQRLERVRCRDYAVLHVHVDTLDDLVAGDPGAGSVAAGNPDDVVVRRGGALLHEAKQRVVALLDESAQLLAERDPPAMPAAELWPASS